MSDSRSYLFIDRENALSLSPSPDHLAIEPETPTSAIGIEAIRKLKSWAILRPFEKRQKTALIKQAQNLTVEAQNAMLKILEEPPEATVIVLTVDDEKNLLPTIISRCTRIFNFPAFALRRQSYGASVTKASAGRQFSILNQFSIFKKEKSFDFSSPSKPSSPSFSIPKEIGERFAFAENLSSQGKETIVQTLSDWLKDLHNKLPDERNPKSLAEKIRAIEETRQAILKNANARLALENLMLKLE
ncbi:MAG: hypothetical protein FJ044_02565 [Candidatus Cloacimonetes bacterium]|nr:hypothetical protein [Candidatus Cloacimonadota bacterium]